jgi:hypothetical protein
MSYDSRFLKAFGITPEPIEPVTRSAACPHSAEPSHIHIRVLPCDEPGYLMISEDDCWATLNSIRSQRQLIDDLRRTVTNWIDQARQNEHEKKQWRGAFAVLASGIALSVAAQVWFWVSQ